MTNKRGRPRIGGRDYHRALRFWMQYQELRTRYRHVGADAAHARALDETRVRFGFQSSTAARQWLWRTLNAAKRAAPELRESLPKGRDLVWIADGDGYVTERGPPT